MKKKITLGMMAVYVITGCSNEKISESTSFSISLFQDHTDVFEINVTKKDTQKEDLIFKSNEDKIKIFSMESAGKYNYICMPILYKENKIRLDCSGYYPSQNNTHGKPTSKEGIFYEVREVNITKNIKYGAEIGKNAKYSFLFNDGNISILEKQ